MDGEDAGALVVPGGPQDHGGLQQLGLTLSVPLYLRRRTASATGAGEVDRFAWDQCCLTEGIFPAFCNSPSMATGAAGKILGGEGFNRTVRPILFVWRVLPVPASFTMQLKLPLSLL